MCRRLRDLRARKKILLKLCYDLDLSWNSPDFLVKQSGENSGLKFLWKLDVFELNEMEGKLFHSSSDENAPSLPRRTPRNTTRHNYAQMHKHGLGAPRLSRNFDLHGELIGDESMGFTMETVQDPKVLIPILMAVAGLILLVVANKIFGVEMSDVQSLLGDSTSTITNALAGIWTSASEIVTNLPDTIKNLLPFWIE